MLGLRLAQAHHSRPFAGLGAARPGRRAYRRQCVAQGAGGSQGPPPLGAGEADQQVAPPPRPESQMPYGAILALSSVGLCETAYLTLAKLTQTAVACPLSEGCADILTSEYASFMGVVPLSSLGLVAYGVVTALAARGLFFSDPRDDAADRRHRTAVLTCGAVMASCSGYLMYVLMTKFSGETCPWCITSALLSFSIAGLAASGMRRRELQEAAAPELGLAATTLLVLSLGLGNPGSSVAEDLVLTYKEPVITTDSSSRAVKLAKRLKEAGAKMYGAFWCSHCYDQKEDFGAQAMKDFPYVECFPEGWQKGVQMAPACQAAGLEGFPTWVIGEQRLKGEQSFEKLEAALEKAVEDVAALGLP